MVKQKLMVKPNRLTKEQFIERVKDLYIRFNNQLYTSDFKKIPFEEFYNDALKEYQKQQNMSDEELQQYRNIQFNELVSDVNKLTTDEERQKLQQESLQQLNQEDIDQYEYKRQTKKEKEEKSKESQ